MKERGPSAVVSKGLSLSQNSYELTVTMGGSMSLELTALLSVLSSGGNLRQSSVAIAAVKRRLVGGLF